MKMFKISQRTTLKTGVFFAAFLFIAALVAPLQAQENAVVSTLISNVRIFDGHKVIAQSGSVRVTDGKISEVSAGLLEAGEADTVVDGEGKFLMPGLIDAHVHVSWAFAFSKADQAGESYATATAVANAAKMLKRGFTTVRDTAGTD